MKTVLIICIIALAGVLGFLAEPSLRQAITGQSANGNEPNPQPTTEAIIIKTPHLNPNDYAPEQLPTTLKITYPTRFVVQASGITVNMDVGSTVRLLRLDGNRVVVSPGETSFEVPLPITNTDLIEQLAGITPIPPSDRKPVPAVAATPPAVPAPVDPNDGEVITSDPNDGEPDPGAIATTGEPPAEPAETATPPEEKPEEHLPPPTKGDVVAIMKNSIMSGEIKEFTFEQVTNWTAGENETVDGLEFATGNVTYQTETLFGKKEIEAKAYLSGKKVVRWVWPKSGIQLE